ncbi:MAG: nucleotidyltransferase domain-containing protein [Candidatus Bathyarchaeota archaeon]|nr:MAG: nucleotidyltransferase domain-containing protein [Candidatus Bathyarchaeota archaeon]
MSKKTVRYAERLVVRYDQHRWETLARLRSKAVMLMEVLERVKLDTILHGSIARGDVSSKSDIDIFIKDPFSSFRVETALEGANITVIRRLIVQATPSYAAKGYIEIDENQIVSFPLVRLRRVEREFYSFSGEITLGMAREKERTAGVDKKLMFIEPTQSGHIETSVVGREDEVARLLGISANTVRDRVRALLRRDSVGRTGVLVKEELTSDETFEMALKRLAESKPEMKRRLRTT